MCKRKCKSLFWLYFWLSLAVQWTELYLHKNADKRNSEIKSRVNWFVILKLQVQKNNPNFNPLDSILLYMLSNNHTSHQKYEVKLAFSCWIYEFLLHISPTTNRFYMFDFNYVMTDIWIWSLFFVLTVMNFQSLEISKENFKISFSSRNLSSVS